MIIHSLKISGFRIIGEPLEIRFPEEGRIGILGQNESGKTTLLQAIEIALYGPGKGVEQEIENLVTWGKNEAELEIEFSSGQDTYVLRRTFGVKSGHKATLVPVVAGVRDESNSLRSLRDIKAKIEQITGMDRDSFTKLVYIKQRDLDALKELAKSKREQLVNKVMGIEVFDEALEDVKKDVSKLEDELEKKSLQLESVRKNKEQYENKLAQKKDLDATVVDLQEKLENKRVLLDEAKDILSKYEWLFSYNSTNEVISTLKGQMESVEKDIERIHNLEDEIKKYSTAIEKYKPEVELLQSLRERFLDLERRLEEAEKSMKSNEEKMQAALERSGLKGKDVELLFKNLPKQKHRQLIISVTSMVCGLVLLAMGLTTNIISSIVGLALLGVATYYFYNYMKVDRLLITGAEINFLSGQVDEDKSKLSNIKHEMEMISAKHNLKSRRDVEDRLLVLSEEMKKEAGMGSISEIEITRANVEKNLRTLKESNPWERKERILRQIQEKEIEISNLEKTKPESIEGLRYDKRVHETAKNRFEELQKEYNDLDKRVQGILGKIQQLNKDLEALKPDYDLYPELEREVQERKSEVELLKRVSTELSETSKELRNKVIPHARLIINQILPTLTDGRYSDFEITEDLKFKVHSNDAGGYKEREIFSGGTQDQFLIALRLAFTQSILDSRVMADKYCLLMDECISSSDEVRKQGIFEVLDAMKNTFSQIFVIAHEDISSFVDHHIVLARNEHGYTEVKSRSW